MNVAEGSEDNFRQLILNTAKDKNLLDDAPPSAAVGRSKRKTTKKGRKKKQPKVKLDEGPSAGAEASVIMDGRMPHSLLLELFTEHGVGTIIRKNDN